MFFDKENVNHRVEEMKEKNQELVEQLDSIFGEFGVTTEELERHLSTSNHLAVKENDPKKTSSSYKKLRKRSLWIPV